MTVNLSRLDNGIRVVTHAMPHLQTASVGVWVNAGARHETDQQHGIAHLLEHMAFKGTATRSARSIAEEIEAVGGDLNAATSLESTAYFARTMKDDLPLALDILADILQNPGFDPDELEREQTVIVQEIGAARDTPDDLVFELAQNAAFPDQPVGRSILGTPETVSGFSSQSLTDYLGTHYRPDAMVIAATGAVDHQDIETRAADLFGGLAGAQERETVAATYVGGEARTSRDLEQTHLVLEFEGVSYLDDDAYTSRVLASALGGGMSSRLFQEVREARGLCYSIFAFASSFRDSGIFGVYAATSPDLVGELVDVTAGEMARFAQTVSEAEIARAKAQLKTGLLMSLESSTARAEQIGRQVLVFGRVLEIDELLAKVDAIDVAAVRTLSEKLFGNSELTLSAVGDLSKLDKRERMAEKFKV
ncbi:MAG: M16 family metallopeptidase [Hyphomicrobiales bacterium]